MTTDTTTAPATAADLLTAVDRDRVDFVLLMFVNLAGKPCAKLTPVAVLPELLRDGIGFAGHAADGVGQSPSDPDVVAIPDPRSYLPMPFQPGLAVVQCDLHVDGEPWPYAPRVLLRAACARLADRGMVLKVGAEPEYMLLDRAPDGSLRVADPHDDGASPCYDARAATRNYDHLTEVSRTLDRWGWGNYSNDHEDANGQFEHNFGYADALTTADRVIAFRYLVHMLAQRSGRIATFMPKPFTHLTGNGLHLHLSLWSAAGEPLFVPTEPGAVLAPPALRFIAGILDHAPGLMALTCPTVNSYKRLGAGGNTASGSSWAPGYATWGGNNRTQMIRVPAPDRIEVRCVDGAANPYLATLGLLAAGLDGVHRGLDPGEPNADNLERTTAARRLPATLAQAADALAADDVLREALGKVPGGEYVDYYASVKRDEFAAYHAQVTDWETRRYLTES